MIIICKMDEIIEKKHYQNIFYVMILRLKINGVVTAVDVKGDIT